MIGIRMMGGLGNLMFQIATGETWRMRGYDVVYTQMDENLDYISNNYTFKRHSEVYKELFGHFNWDEHKSPKDVSFKHVHVPYVYTEIEPVDWVEYIGYFQSEKNFPNREFIRHLFKPSEMVKSKLSYPICEHSCSIHVRRQDYLKLQDYHHNLSGHYYEKAIDTLSGYRIDRFYVFSDDIEWCKQTFIGEPFIFMNCLEYVALYLMSECKYNIIANSSLSWWGAWLGDQQERVVVAPQVWFGAKGQNPKDLIPENWIKV